MRKYEVIAENEELPVGTMLTFDVESVWLKDKNGKFLFCDKWPMAIASSYYFGSVVKIDQHPEIYKPITD